MSINYRVDFLVTSVKLYGKLIFYWDTVNIFNAKKTFLNEFDPENRKCSSCP